MFGHLIGGVGVVALSQAKELARLGHQVTAFTPATMVKRLAQD